MTRKVAPWNIPLEPLGPGGVQKGQKELLWIPMGRKKKKAESEGERKS